VLPHVDVASPAVAELAPKTQARFGDEPEQPPHIAKSTKTAEAMVPTGAAPATATQK
jgi:hypothetical protein